MRVTRNVKRYAQLSSAHLARNGRENRADCYESDHGGGKAVGGRVESRPSGP